jgi:uncharacterized protein (TIGR00251 family)
MTMMTSKERTPSPSSSWITLGDGFVTIEIVARPSASRQGIVRLDPRGLVIALNSAPDRGKANDELVDFLARTLKVARGTIEIVRGQTSRRKTVRIGPCDTTAVAARLDALAHPAS